MKSIVVIASIMISSIALAGSKGNPPGGMSESEWKKHQEIDRQMEAERRAEFDRTLRLNPPAPPWIKYPDHGKTDLFWRMGKGETYLMENIWPYFKYASKSELEAYMKKYPEPKNWSGWYRAN